MPFDTAASSLLMYTASDLYPALHAYIALCDAFDCPALPVIKVSWPHPSSAVVLGIRKRIVSPITICIPEDLPSTAISTSKGSSWHASAKVLSIPENHSADQIWGGGAVADSIEQVGDVACIDAQCHQSVNSNLKRSHHHTVLCLLSGGYSRTFSEGALQIASEWTASSKEPPECCRTRGDCSQAETHQVFGITQGGIVVIIGGVARIEAKLLCAGVVGCFPVLYPASRPEGNAHIEAPTLHISMPLALHALSLECSTSIYIAAPCVDRRSEMLTRVATPGVLQGLYFPIPYAEHVK